MQTQFAPKNVSTICFVFFIIIYVVALVFVSV